MGEPRVLPAAPARDLSPFDCRPRRGIGGVHDPRGFDHWEVLPDQGDYHDPTFLTMDGGSHVRPGYATDLITDLALEWLGSVAADDPGAPWCLPVQHKAPHRPWEPAERHADLTFESAGVAPETFFDDYSHRASPAREARMRVGRDLHREDLKADPPSGADREVDPAAYAQWALERYLTDYLRCVVAVDEGVGRLLDHLEATGQADDTVVIYTSDQGFFLGEHGWYASRYIERERQEAAYFVPGFAENMEALKRNFFFRGFFNDRGYFNLADISPAAYRQGVLTAGGDRRPVGTRPRQHGCRQIDTKGRGASRAQQAEIAPGSTACIDGGRPVDVREH